MQKKGNYPIVLLVIFLIIWIVLAINPNHRSVWIDENILTVLFVGLLVLSYRRFRFSNLSYGLLFVFMVLHSVGAHYSYNQMPLFDLIREIFNLSRNHYDRVVHFLFGVLFFVPVYDILVGIFRVPKGWRGLFVAFFVVVDLKGGFEVIEYGYVWVKEDPLTVTNYLGEQGDTWDSQKDVFLGTIGAGISWFLVGLRGLVRWRKVEGKV